MGLFGPPPSNMRPAPVPAVVAPALPVAPPEVDADTAVALLEAERIAELTEASAPFQRLIRCCQDSTLFLSTSGRAMTAWRWKVGGRWQVRYESGFPARPSSFMFPREPVDEDAKGTE